MEAVHRYEGTVNQVMGDGIMALFGAPLAHEDHAVRGCFVDQARREGSVGSSRSKSRGSVPSARASSSCRCSPYDSSDTRVLARSIQPPLETCTSVIARLHGH
jgi:hypothetical protein